MLPGLIRKNGVPYSGEATVTEYGEQHEGPTGAQYLVVFIELRDPVYLHGSRWDPTPCSLTSTP